MVVACTFMFRSEVLFYRLLFFIEYKRVSSRVADDLAEVRMVQPSEVDGL